MTSKQRAYLRSLAMTMDPIFQIGKSSLTPEFTSAINEVLEARELIKISVLQNCMDDPKELAQILAERGVHHQKFQQVWHESFCILESLNRVLLRPLT